jgi:hypothetical protein
MTRTVLAFVAVLGVAAACRPPPLDTKKAEDAIRTELKAKGVTLVSVTCPSGIALKTGTTFQCTAQDDQGTTGVFDMTVKDDKGDIAWQLEGKYMDMKVLGDNLEGRISKASNNKVVDVTCPSKNILVAKGTTFTCDILVGTSAAKIVFTSANNEASLDYKIVDQGSVGASSQPK